MSLTRRFSVLCLAILTAVLLVFSTAVYVSAWIHLDRQTRERVEAALAVLAAAAEIHPKGVEWEPQERELHLGQETGPDRLRWLVFDDRGRRVDHSRNWTEAELADQGTNWERKTRRRRQTGLSKIRRQPGSSFAVVSCLTCRRD